MNSLQMWQKKHISEKYRVSPLPVFQIHTIHYILQDKYEEAQRERCAELSILNCTMISFTTVIMVCLKMCGKGYFEVIILQARALPLKTLWAK